MFRDRIVHRDPLRVTVADINRVYFGKTDAHPDLLHRALNLSALPQNWTDGPFKPSFGLSGAAEWGA